MNAPDSHFRARPTYRINAFPGGEDIWRVDWFGCVDFPNRMLQSNHRSVQVLLSKVVARDALTKPDVLLDPNSTLPARQQTKRWVSVGTLVILRVGHLWQDQRLIATPSYEEEVFQDVAIYPNTTDLIKAGLGHGDSGVFLLPLAEHPWHRGGTQSYCVQVRLPDGRYMIVPCMELIRFYFGSSSSLLSRLFLPGLSRKKLFTAVDRGEVDGCMKLTLAEGLNGASARDIARMAGSDEAFAAALRISDSCLQATTTGQVAYPSMPFPFTGMTTLAAKGKWLSRGNHPRQTFLVYSLTSCSHAFPFQSLHYSVEGDSSKDAAAQSPDGFRRMASKAATDPVFMERDGSSALSEKVLDVPVRAKFPYLARKTVARVRDLPSGQPPMAANGDAVNALTVGGTGSTERIRSVALAEATGASIGTGRPAYLDCVVEALNALAGCDVHVLTASHEDGWTIPLDMLPGNFEVTHGPDAIAIGEGDIRLRNVCVFSVRRGDHLKLLIAAEGAVLVPVVSTCDVTEAQDGWMLLMGIPDEDLMHALGQAGEGFAVDWQQGSNTAQVFSEWLRAQMRPLFVGGLQSGGYSPNIE